MSDDAFFEVTPSTLRIRFGEGERPYRFWVGLHPQSKRRFKVLSKHTSARALEVLVVEEAGRSRRVLAHRVLDPNAPSGWIEHWVGRLESALDVRFRSYDLRHVRDAEEWRRVTRTLGWGGETSASGGGA